MILEGVVTTLDRAGRLNVAPMGPIVPDDAPPTLSGFLLRPYPTSKTYANLLESGEGVFHVVDDVLLIARAVIGDVEPTTVAAMFVKGRRLADCCRYFEFQVVERHESEARARFAVRVVDQGRVRDFFGFNRAKHAVVEAAVLVSRLGVLPYAEIVAEMARLRAPVEKTAGNQEREAFALLNDHVRAVEGTT